MLIVESRTLTTVREVKCFMVDYNRLKLNGWPRLTPVGDYKPARQNRNAAHCVDRIRALQLLTMGLSTVQVAARLGCHRSTIADIRAAARDPAAV